MSEHTRLLRTKVSGSNSASSTVSPAQMGVSVHCLNQLSSSCTMILGYLVWLAHSEELEPESYRSAFLSIWDRQTKINTLLLSPAESSKSFFEIISLSFQFLKSKNKSMLPWQQWDYPLIHAARTTTDVSSQSSYPDNLASHSFYPDNN